jgi:HPr kinase/phosphorylase
MAMLNLHATCIAFDGDGVLLTGASGSGKSDLALRALETGACLVADDRTELTRGNDGRLIAQAPPQLAGLIEVRGLGILRWPHLAQAALRLVVALVPPEQVPRLPGEGVADHLGVVLPRLLLTPFEASAVTKLRLATRLAAGHIMRAS